MVDSRDQTPRRDTQTLIFDADDTLWENNVLFERVVDDFIGWLDHPTLDRGAIRLILNDIERANVVAHGYGVRGFLESLADTFAQLNERPTSPAERREIEELAQDLIEMRIDLVPGVDETLAFLRQRHELLLLTKGREEDQRKKLEVSGLGHYFDEVVIVPEKVAQVYHDLADRRGLDRSLSWMIGNSPKSDILPAIEAGMRAVFIPNDNTWQLENADFDPDDERIITIESFPDLLLHF
ncbi:MAG: HAD family hydrolase [Thermomicrobiales bacterium]